jgi:leucyl-tRNA synthetase
MEITNALYKYDLAVKDENKNIKLVKDLANKFIQVIAPFAPHFAEEMWSKYGNEKSVFLTNYPICEEKWMVKDEIELPVQINGNVKFKINVGKDADAVEIEKTVLDDERLSTYLNGRSVKKVIVIKSKIVNVVVG